MWRQRMPTRLDGEPVAVDQAILRLHGPADAVLMESLDVVPSAIFENGVVPFMVEAGWRLRRAFRFPMLSHMSL